MALPTAVRVMSVTNGGQTFLSQPAADWLRAEAGSTRRIHSHGHWRLKGLEEPIELFEVGPSDTALIPPAGSAKAYRVLWIDGLWTSALSLPHNLGPEPDVFVGRERELRPLAWAFESGAQVDLSAATLANIGSVGSREKCAGIVPSLNISLPFDPLKRMAIASVDATGRVIPCAQRQHDVVIPVPAQATNGPEIHPVFGVVRTPGTFKQTR